MRKWGLALAFAVAAVVMPVTAGGANATAHTRVSALDAYWLKTSAQGDAFEIKGGKIAQSKGSDDSVKSLGARLVKDHSKSLADAAKLGHKFGIKVEPQPTPSEQWELDIVQSESGKSFDQWYAKLEVRDHVQDIEDAQQEVKSGSNAAIRAEARKDLPMLRMHLGMAKAALKKVS
jgi:putative membrane protein